MRNDVWGGAFVAEGIGAEGLGALVGEVHRVGFRAVFVAVVLEFAALVLEDVALGGGGEVGGGVGAGEADGPAEHVHLHVGEVVGVGGLSLGEDGVEIDEGLELFSGDGFLGGVFGWEDNELWGGDVDHSVNEHHKEAEGLEDLGGGAGGDVGDASGGVGAFEDVLGEALMLEAEGGHGSMDSGRGHGAGDLNMAAEELDDGGALLDQGEAEEMGAAVTHAARAAVGPGSMKLRMAGLRRRWTQSSKRRLMRAGLAGSIWAARSGMRERQRSVSLRTSSQRASYSETGRRRRFSMSDWTRFCRAEW